MSNHLLCEWHIAKAVLTQVKKNRLFDDNKLKDKFIARFARVISSPTEDLYKSKLEAFKTDYQQQQVILSYIDKTWLEPWSKRFVRAFADRHLHFENRATSRVEGGHSALKRYLQISTGDLKHALDKINLMLANQVTEHKAAMAQAKDRMPQRLNISFFAELAGRVTPFALHKIIDQRDLLKNSIVSTCYHTM